MRDREDIGAFTIKDFCKAYSSSRSFVYAEIRAGRLIAHKAQSKTLILQPDAERWASALPAISPRRSVSSEIAESEAAA